MWTLERLDLCLGTNLLIHVVSVELNEMTT
jgi:hypothetical protein